MNANSSRGSDPWGKGMAKAMSQLLGGEGHEDGGMARFYPQEIRGTGFPF